MRKHVHRLWKRSALSPAGCRLPPQCRIFSGPADQDACHEICRQSSIPLPSRLMHEAPILVDNRLPIQPHFWTPIDFGGRRPGPRAQFPKTVGVHDSVHFRTHFWTPIDFPSIFGLKPTRFRTHLAPQNDGCPQFVHNLAQFGPQNGGCPGFRPGFRWGFKDSGRRRRGRATASSQAGTRLQTL